MFNKFRVSLVLLLISFTGKSQTSISDSAKSTLELSQRNMFESFAIGDSVKFNQLTGAGYITIIAMLV